MEAAEFYRCVWIVIDQCLGVRPGEQVLIVSDTAWARAYSRGRAGLWMAAFGTRQQASIPGRYSSGDDSPGCHFDRRRC